MYKLYKLVCDHWWFCGAYADVLTLATAAHQLGLDGFSSIKVEVVG
jgi:hypothetical protein